jgi:hypothetical protein
VNPVRLAMVKPKYHFSRAVRQQIPPLFRIRMTRTEVACRAGSHAPERSIAVNITTDSTHNPKSLSFRRRTAEESAASPIA